mmetsp:Transcript_4601/g.5315  ORF Transcript_4601/g.5315 Transcript_4601/m.5315 type:complete len:277 (+) Transcript_4601:133-963(+)|eukprot:CAMPEP_0197843736 /NCGR_PEP_ID=MMETSP1438-20131217/667_1 /TAXON_ID=1461541 /ORGANISM="Pterosperma sp., Strain CCMP1384" /LENGTH=276 /DNA_ID=CAMNT_0043454091 /DNA_START=126 /DNA_END=956 /DNA_ORIENTATION=-
MVGVRDERSDGQRPQFFEHGNFSSRTTHKDTFPAYGKVPRVVVDSTLEGGWKYNQKPVPNCPAEETFKSSYTQHHAEPGWHRSGHVNLRFPPVPMPTQEGELSRITTTRAEFAKGLPVVKPRTFKRGIPNEYTHPQGLAYPHQKFNTTSHNQDHFAKKKLTQQPRHAEDIVIYSRPYVKHPDQTRHAAEWTTTHASQYEHPQKAYPTQQFPQPVAIASDKYNKCAIPTGVSKDTISTYNHVNGKMFTNHRTLRTKYPLHHSTYGPTFAGDMDFETN